MACSRKPCCGCVYEFQTQQDEREVREYLDQKEHIAAVIFDHDYPEDEERPSEERCHTLAEEILELVFEISSPYKPEETS